MQSIVAVHKLVQVRGNYAMAPHSCERECRNVQQVPEKTAWYDGDVFSRRSPCAVSSVQVAHVLVWQLVPNSCDDLSELRLQ